MPITSFRIVAAMLAFCLTFCAGDVARTAGPPRVRRVGQIIVVGNERTLQSVILRQIPLSPGQMLTDEAIHKGEANLARLGIFETSDDVRPTITVVGNPAEPDSEFKDVLVRVQETATGSLTWRIGVNSEDGLFLSIELSERNLDVTRFPTSLDDLDSGNAFRGAGQAFRVELRLGTQMPRFNVMFRDPTLSENAWELREWIANCLGVDAGVAAIGLFNRQAQGVRRAEYEATQAPPVRVGQIMIPPYTQVLPPSADARASFAQTLNALPLPSGTWKWW